MDGNLQNAFRAQEIRWGGGGVDKGKGEGSFWVPSGAAASPHPYLHRGGAGTSRAGRPPTGTFMGSGRNWGGFRTRRVYAPGRKRGGDSTAQAPAAASFFFLAEPQEGPWHSEAWGPRFGAGAMLGDPKNTPCLPTRAPQVGGKRGTHRHTRARPPFTPHVPAVPPQPPQKNKKPSSLPAGPA